MGNSTPLRPPRTEKYQNVFEALERETKRSGFIFYMQESFRW